MDVWTPCKKLCNTDIAQEEAFRKYQSVQFLIGSQLNFNWWILASVWWYILFKLNYIFFIIFFIFFLNFFLFFLKRNFIFSKKLLFKFKNFKLNSFIKQEIMSHWIFLLLKIDMISSFSTAEIISFNHLITKI